MFTPRWRKVLMDLWSSKARTLLVALSIAVGIFSVGVVTNSFISLRDQVSTSFMAVNPHSGRIFTSPFDDDLLQTLRRTPGVERLEGRTSVTGKVRLSSGELVSINITAIPPIDTMQIDQLRLVQGASSLQDKEIYLERGAQSALGIKPGDSIQVQMADGRWRDVRVAGLVHDITVDPFWVSRQVYGYSTLGTQEWLGGSRQYTGVLFNVSENNTDVDHVNKIAGLINDRITRSGGQVYFTVVFRPGLHPAQPTIDSALAVLGGLGLLALLLSTFLVINTIIALMSQQVRQIGMMKAVGATMGQVAGMYLVLIVTFGIVALIIAIPLSALAATALTAGVLALLNMDPSGIQIPTAALVLEIAVGILVPLIAGAVPVLNGTRLTVREAISTYGLAMGAKRGWFDRLLESVQGLPRPLLLSLRNTFRRKARLGLTISTLILGGAMFIAVFNVQASLYRAIDVTLGYVLSDVNVGFARAYRMGRILDVTKDIPGVVEVEGWGDLITQAIRLDGKSTDQVEFIAPPNNSRLISPVLTAGRWLVPGDENAVVVGNHFIKLRPDVKVGDTIKVKVNNREEPFKVVGIYEMAGTVLAPVLYTNFDYLAKLQNAPGQVYSLRVVTDLHDPQRQQQVAKDLEQTLNSQGLEVTMATPGSVFVQQNRVSIDVLVYLLMAMAMLIAVVGGLGLMGTMSMNVLERTREIGVMRSIGAVNGSIFRLVVVEGMIIGVISWIFGAILSIPIAKGLGTILGVSLLNVPLEYRFSLNGLLIWVVVMLAISALACMLPARNAVRLTVRDVLAYE